MTTSAVKLMSPATIRAYEEEAERLRLIQRVEEAADFLWLMTQQEGRRAVRRLIERAKVLRSTFSPENPHQTSFNEGFRRYGTEIAELVNDRCPKLYALMMQEAAQ